MKKTALKAANDIVDTERQRQYGDPVKNMVEQAIIASTMGVPVSASDVARVMIAVKTQRTASNDNQDTRIDLIGYTEILDRTIAAEKSGETKRIAKELLLHLL